MGVFSNIFSSKPKLADANFVNPITTEFHSHLIPAIDDGVKNIEESILVLRVFSEMGYKKVITTPHIQGDFFKNSPDNILSGLETVRQRLIEENINIQLEAAAEYLIDDLLEEKIEKKQLLTFGNNHVQIGRAHV